MPPSPSYNDIVAAANAQLAALDAADQKLAGEITAIQLAAAGAPLSDVDRAKIAQLNAARGDIAPARQKIARVAGAALDNSAEIRALITGLQQAQTDLQARQAQLSQFAADAAQFAAIAGGVAALGTKLATLATTIGGVVG